MKPAADLQHKPASALWWYGAVIVAACFIIFSVAYGVRLSFAVFFVALLNEFGWSRTLLAGVFSLGTLVFGITSPAVGALLDRYGSRRVMLAGAAITGVSLVLCSRISAPWQLYLLYGVVLSVGLGFLGLVPQVSLLSRWFVRWFSSAMGIAFAGVGISMVVGGPLVQVIIDRFGWRWAFVALAGFVGAFIVPLVLWVLKEGPEEVGRGPDGDPIEEVGERLDEAEDEQEDWTVAKAAATVPFWALVGCFFFTPLGIFPIVVHHVVYLVDAGFSTIFAATVFGVQGVMSSVGKMAIGYLADRLGRPGAILLSYGLSAAGILALLTVRDPSHVWRVYLFAATFGFALGTRGPIVSAATADHFRGRRFGTIYGVVHFSNGVGGAVGPIVAGYLFDHTGSYSLAFLLAFACLAVAAWTLLVAVRWPRATLGTVVR
jgi:MFS family permease